MKMSIFVTDFFSIAMDCIPEEMLIKIAKNLDYVTLQSLAKYVYISC